MLFDGNTARIKSTATDFDDQPLTNLNVISAIVNLYDNLGNYVFTNQAMTWNPTFSYWFFDWQDALPGTFTAEAVFSGSGYEVSDYGIVVVLPLRVIPTGNPTPIVN